MALPAPAQKALGIPISTNCHLSASIPLQTPQPVKPVGPGRRHEGPFTATPSHLRPSALQAPLTEAPEQSLVSPPASLPLIISQFREFAYFTRQEKIPGTLSRYQNEFFLVLNPRPKGPAAKYRDKAGGWSPR